VSAWNGWYHVDGHTYGTWLRGDPRGWRSRKHREHVDGDYRHPPPEGMYDDLWAHSKALMKHDPVHLDRHARRAAGQALVEMLRQQNTELLVLSMDAVHFHLLGRFAGGGIRSVVGRAKKHAYHVLRSAGHTGRLWARRCRPLPVTDRAHQLNVFRYIRNHGARGAWVWTFREGLYWPSVGGTEGR